MINHPHLENPVSFHVTGYHPFHNLYHDLVSFHADGCQNQGLNSNCLGLNHLASSSTFFFVSLELDASNSPSIRMRVWFSRKLLGTCTKQGATVENSDLN
nr:hypothetical protein HmN_000335500 [Hymenolepis microstoma]